MPSYIAAIDQGTTQTTAVIIDEHLSIIAKESREFPQIYPKPGWVEHDPEAIFVTAEAALAAAVARAGIRPSELVGIGITNQRETTVVWERATSRPIHNAIVWQCRRTADACDVLRHAGHEQLIRESTGLLLDPYFSGTKLRWILEHVEGALRRAAAGELCFGTVDSWLVWKLSGGKAHVTDLTNASRTLLCDINKGDWSDELLALFGVPRAVLPRVTASDEIVGHTAGVPGLPDGIPIAGIAGDQQAALFGQACFSEGDAKCTYGTGAFLMMNTGSRPVPSSRGLLTTVAWKLGGKITYALEGSVFIAGAAVQWLRDGLGIIRTAADIEPLARSVPDSAGVVFVPALAGLGAPHWRPEARGLITGITRGTTAAHLARACLEGIALQVTELLDAMQVEAQRPLPVLKVDGGAAANDLLLQIQSDLLGKELSRPTSLETTAMGAAFLAGLGVGLWPCTDAIRRAWKEERHFSPEIPRERAAATIAGFRAAVAKA